MKARIITSRDKIRSLAVDFEHWANLYRQSGHREHDMAMSHLAAIKALDVETATVADVTAIWSMLTGWVTMSCDCCDTRDLEWVIQVGQEASCESRTVDLCRACLAEAVEVAA